MIQLRAKSEASTSMVRGRSGWKCWRTREVVKACRRLRMATLVASDQVNLTFLPVRVVRGEARDE